MIRDVKKAADRYDARQLLPASSSMLKKLNIYWKIICEQPAYVGATCLDPRFKLKFFDTYASTLLDLQPPLPLRKIRSTFRQEAEEFKTLASVEDTIDMAPVSSPVAATDQFQQDFYANEPAPAENSLQAEIDVYLASPVVNAKPLDFWSGKKHELPILAKMARFYLAIPATSAPAERVFSQSRRVARWDRARLNPETLEANSCTKSWNRKFGYRSAE
ncbi:ribonuclease H-like domain-containing protein [Phlyctochytrium arcticum]|nr:ribonuclease H-like domain-containing protein [Phlyctochytrium arcticum]